MAGRPPRNQALSQQEDIAEMKADVVVFFEKYGMKEAAANSVGRTIQTVRDWEEADEDFRNAMLRAKAKFASAKLGRVKLDNLYANLYADDFKPPKQEVEQTGLTQVTITHVHPTDSDQPDAQAG